MPKHQIAVSEETWNYIRNIQRKYKLEHNHKHIEYSEIVDELICKVKQIENTDSSKLHIRKRNLKPMVEKFK